MGYEPKESEGSRGHQQAKSATDKYLHWGMLPQQEVAAPYDPKDFESAACLTQATRKKLLFQVDMKFHIRTTCRVYVVAFYWHQCRHPSWYNPFSIHSHLYHPVSLVKAIADAVLGLAEQYTSGMHPMSCFPRQLLLLFSELAERPRF